MRAEYLQIGEIVKPQGIRGEVKLRAMTQDMARYARLETVYLLEGGEYVPRRVLKGRAGGGFAFLQLEGIGDRNQAEALRGRGVYVDREHAIPLGEDENFVCELIGLEAVGSRGARIGRLREDVYKRQAQRNAQPAIAYPRNHRQHAQGDSHKRGLQRPARKPVQRIQGQKPQQQGKDDILLHPAGNAAEDQHVKGNFGKEGQQEQPPGIGAQIVRVGIALGQEETIQGKSQPADTAKHTCRGEKRQPHVIDAHADKRDEPESKRGQKAASLRRNVNPLYLSLIHICGDVSTRGSACQPRHD